MDFRTPTEITPLPLRLRHSDKLLVMGSCFADHIGGRLRQMKFRTVVNPYGVLYNPLSTIEGLNRLAEQRFFTEEEAEYVRDNDGDAVAFAKVWVRKEAYSK